MTFALLVPYEDDRRLTVSWTVVIVLAGLALLGEILEFAAGAWGASRAGASRRGTTLALIGSIVGGLIGVAIGLPVSGCWASYRRATFCRRWRNGGWDSRGTLDGGVVGR